MKLNVTLKNIDDIICIVLLVMLVVVAFLQILFRFVFNLPLDWSEEFTRYTFIFLVYLSTTIAVKEKVMIRIELIELLLNKQAMKFVNMFIYLTTASFSFLLSYFNITVIKNAYFIHQNSPALAIPVWILFVLQLLLFFIIGSRYIFLFIDQLRRLNN